MEKEFVVSYCIGNSLYLNITNRCYNKCIFCIRQTKTGVGYNLWLSKEPSVQEVLAAVPNPQDYQEIVFCGYGEPLCRLELVRSAAAELKKRGARIIRVNTNGQANLIYGRNIVPELAGLVDVISISLNAQDAATYVKLCQPVQGEQAYYSMLDFVKKCVGVIPRVILSVVAWPGVDLEACRSLAKKLGAEFRLRQPTH
ncbi:TatD family nuclease-associated radical SAM protein [Desulforamulus hydrothermalis]|uniref:Radical SAM domain protein n=1 Tax=Desulforamulus hydrothermalis Lam5 = DSM 18033 TaxID=1121428 RepID=K8DX47_9FIRM|nr:TatD family nuclease-associated radical SAM protein [Desulforamulus hydrothermalis]CCO07127.1 Radical SAM domain protein [Desulforamulus hydrothermalis Lam5 = DSM 18033]SHG89502.1 radical SAM protein, TatD family-associated [Desulforamulus hydrothermalis Lam5 = DSM 18033]